MSFHWSFYTTLISLFFLLPHLGEVGGKSFCFSFFFYIKQVRDLYLSEKSTSWGCKQSDTAERLILSLCYWGTSKKMANHTPSNVTKGSKHDPNPSDKEKKFLCNNRPRRSNCAFSGVIHKRPSLLIVSAFPLGEKMVFSQSIVY